MQDQRTLGQRVDRIRRRAQRDPEGAAVLASAVLRELHGGGGPAGPYAELHTIRGRGVALMALRLGQDRYDQRVARAGREQDLGRRTALLELAERERPHWSAAGRQLGISHTAARDFGEPALAEAMTEQGLPTAVVGAPS
jgi:hypothetical protein